MHGTVPVETLIRYGISSELIGMFSGISDEEVSKIKQSLADEEIKTYETSVSFDEERTEQIG